MQDADSGINKVPIIIALVLALALVAGVIVGAKVVFDQAANTPVSVAALDTPEADSAECRDFVAAAPESVIGLRRARIEEPAPAGVAAWKKSSERQITVRCGVHAPLQFTALSQLEGVDGTQWLPVFDTTVGSSLETWYAVNRSKVVAVTMDKVALGQAAPREVLSDLAVALATVPQAEPQAYPLPLSDVAAGTEDTSKCKEVLADLPAEITSDTHTYTRSDSSAVPDGVAWTALGLEPIMVRCGVEFPAGYAAGERLTQVDGVPWFEDTTVGNGTTASTWYAVEQHPTVVASMPQAVAQSVLVELSGVVKSRLG